MACVVFFLLEMSSIFCMNTVWEQKILGKFFKGLAVRCNMELPPHTHPKDAHWAFRFGLYIALTLIFLNAAFQQTPPFTMWLLLGYALWRLIVWGWNFFACIHCLIRLLLALFALLLVYFQLPKPYYLAAILFVWGDALLRFGHGFITEKIHDD